MKKELKIQKTLYLLRHAKSSWKNLSLNDFDRPLNKRGNHDAPLMAEKMKAGNLSPDSIISSPAKRAKKTAEVFSDVLQSPLYLEAKLYEGSIEEILWIINKAFETQDEVMIVGHNPELTFLNDLLSDKEIFNIPTSGIVAIDFEAYPIEKGRGRQRFFDFPKRYRKAQ